jgi:hypothetical protein
MQVLDQSRVEAFTSFGHSVDRIATFRTVRKDFLASLPANPFPGFGDDYLISRLFQLRKMGRLPKHHLRRRFS